MEKKITWKDYCYMKHNSSPLRLARLFSSCYLLKETEGGGCYRIRVKMRWFWYLLLWLPLQLAEILRSMWDGGLRECSWLTSRALDEAPYYIYDKKNPDSIYSRMDKVWESYN